MVPFESLGMDSYSSAIAMAVSLAVMIRNIYETFSVKESVTFKTGLGVVPGR